MKLVTFTVTYIFLFNLICQSYSAKILGIFPSCGYSQFILGGKLMRELSAKGHNVTVVSSFPTKTPITNYNDVPISGLAELCKETDLFDLESGGSIANIIAVHEYGSFLTNYTLSDDNVKQLLNSNVTFDLVICELFFDYALMAFAHHFKAPLVLFSSQGPHEWSKNFLRHPTPFVYIPFGSGSYTYEMVTTQRIKNFLDNLFFDVFDTFVIIPRHNKYIKEHLPDSPDISEIIPTIELVLYNSHISTNVAVPLLPNMIEIGGFHIDPKPLSESLQKFLDEATDGAIYFSMGSNLKSSNFPAEKRNAIFKALSTFKQKVLWKFEDENIEELPKNIKIGKWLPQQDILAHPNVKLFITHSGLLSTIEAVYFGVPILSIPVFGDQRMNAALAEKRGIGLTLNFNNITEKSLVESIKELLNNPKYTANAQFRSTIMKDQETKPLEKALFWIDYVLRHKGTRHLQIYGVQMSWCQFYAIDLIGIAITLILISLLICRFIIRKLRNCIDNSKEKIKKQ